MTKRILPLALRIVGVALTVIISTRPEASVRFDTVATCASEIFSMIADLLSPVPAVGGPAFCAKKTSFVLFDLYDTIRIINGIRANCEIIPYNSLVEQGISWRPCDTG